MPKLTKSTVKELKSEIKLWMAKVPGISALQLSQKLNRDYDLIRYVKNEIDEENSKQIEQESVAKEIARFQLLVDGLMPHLWNILAEAGSSPMEKIAAIRTIVENNRILFDKKFDAGFQFLFKNLINNTRKLLL